MAKQKKVIVVLGPTASGKTAYAIQLAKQYHTAIINADSRQVYREMKTGTARPGEEELQGVKHYCLGHISIHDDYNAGIFEREALAALEEIFAEQDVAVVCGGTGLYINALLYGFDELPAADPKIREAINALYEEKGLAGLQQKLQSLDPEHYEIIDEHNPQRLMRAIEICVQSGKKHHELKKNQKKERGFEIEKTAIDMPREILYERINQRVDKMMAEGLEEEAKKLFPYADLPVLKTVGYSELFDYFRGISTKEEAIEKIKQHTRNYAKRQLTWFRRDDEIKWIKPGSR